MKIGKKTLSVFIVALSLFIGAELYYYFSSRVTILVDGKKLTFYTRLKTVNDILHRKKIKINPDDIVIPSLESDIKYPGIIKVIRVRFEEKEAVESGKIQVLKKEKSKANLRAVIYKKIKIPRRREKIKITYHDGVEVKKEVIESKDDSRIEELLYLLDDSGKVVKKVYNLSASQKMKMIATAYYPGDPLAWRDGTITFLGMKMQRGIVAVDPKVIPLRTRVFVPGYGYGFAADTGSMIKGNRIDLGVNNAEEERPWMHRPVTVYILGPSRKW